MECKQQEPKGFVRPADLSVPNPSEVRPAGQSCGVSSETRQVWKAAEEASRPLLEQIMLTMAAGRQPAETLVMQWYEAMTKAGMSHADAVPRLEIILAITGNATPEVTARRLLSGGVEL